MNCKNKLSPRELANLLCKHVTVRAGEDVEESGKLVCVGRDFIAIKTDDREVLYFPLNNVRSVSVATDRSCCNTERKKVCNDTFQSILRKLINCKVRVNDGSDDDGQVEGVLTRVNRTSIQVVEDDELVIIAIGSINFISQAGEIGDDESSNCRILCCKKENPCGKKKEECKKECKVECKVECKKESSSSSSIIWCKPESSSSSSSSSVLWCKKESSSSSSWCKESSSTHDHWKKKKRKKRNSEDLESRGWFKL
ncbi:hypothetical protein P4V41_01820 [Fictibacillus nanhaiensis]|uniref:hypothetical protein n=1 Tax=Fictibacillus nanhaiensis TaxID=742169 RepID=UPI002E1E8279|nr:hypothetical protein [Fictibacillus nanhaiensis]